MRRFPLLVPLAVVALAVACSEAEPGPTLLNPVAASLDAHYVDGRTTARIHPTTIDVRGTGVVVVALYGSAGFRAEDLKGGNKVGFFTSDTIPPAPLHQGSLSRFIARKGSAELTAGLEEVGFFTSDTIPPAPLHHNLQFRDLNGDHRMDAVMIFAVEDLVARRQLPVGSTEAVVTAQMQKSHGKSPTYQASLRGFIVSDTIPPAPIRSH